MAVIIFQRRLFQILCTALARASIYHTKFKSKSTSKVINHHNDSPVKVLHQNPPISPLKLINSSKFSSISHPRFNVSTYENLVNQKCTGNVEKKPPEKPLPGRHKFHAQIEDALNEQVSIEFNACFSYLAMAGYYGRTEVALPGCQGFFMNMHMEEHEHAIVFLNYILMRGGHVHVPSICPPDNQDFKDITKALSMAVEMECKVKEKLELLVELAEKHQDHQLVDFISAGFLKEQNQSICTIARLLTRSKMVNSETGEYLFDQHLYDSFVKQSKGNLMYKTNLEEDKENKETYK